MCVSLQRRHLQSGHVRFATVACAQMYETCHQRPRPLASYENQPFYYSFGHPTSTKCRKGSRTTRQVALRYSFGRPTSTKSRKGCLPCCPPEPTPDKKRKTLLRGEKLFEELPFSTAVSAAIAAALFSSFSQQPFLAAILSSHPPRLSSAAISAAIRSSLSQRIRRYLASSCCGQGLVVNYFDTILLR